MTEEEDDDTPQAQPMLAWISQIPAPPPPPPATSAHFCETSALPIASASDLVAAPASASPLAGADSPVAAGPSKPDPDNLADSLGLRPVVPQPLAPSAPVQPVQQQAFTGGGDDPHGSPQPSAPTVESPGQGGAAGGLHSQAADPARQVAMRLKRAANSGEDILTIELHPAELGRVSVRLGFHEGRVDVRLVVDRRETFDAFTQDRAALEQQLAQAGIDLGSGGLDLRFGGGSATPEAPTTSTAASGTASADPLAPARQIRLLAEGLVDIVA